MKEKLLNQLVGIPSWLIAIVKTVFCIGEHPNWNDPERVSIIIYHIFQVGEK